MTCCLLTQDLFTLLVSEFTGFGLPIALFPSIIIIITIIITSIFFFVTIFLQDHTKTSPIIKDGILYVFQLFGVDFIISQFLSQLTHGLPLLGNWSLIFVRAKVTILLHFWFITRT
jgi:uncharacterized membrane protein